MRKDSANRRALAVGWKNYPPPVGLNLGVGPNGDRKELTAVVSYGGEDAEVKMQTNANGQEVDPIVNKERKEIVVKSRGKIKVGKEGWEDWQDEVSLEFLICYLRRCRFAD